MVPRAKMPIAPHPRAMVKAGAINDLEINDQEKQDAAMRVAPSAAERNKVRRAKAAIVGPMVRPVAKGTVVPTMHRATLADPVPLVPIKVPTTALAVLMGRRQVAPEWVAASKRGSRSSSANWMKSCTSCVRSRPSTPATILPQDRLTLTAALTVVLRKPGTAGRIVLAPSPIVVLIADLRQLRRAANAALMTAADL